MERQNPHVQPPGVHRQSRHRQNNSGPEIARIYKKIGLLSKDTFVEVDRSGLVAGYPKLMERFTSSRTIMRI